MNKSLTENDLIETFLAYEVTSSFWCRTGSIILKFVFPFLSNWIGDLEAEYFHRLVKKKFFLFKRYAILHNRKAKGG